MKTILLITFVITLLFYSAVVGGTEEKIHIDTNESCFGFFGEQIPCREDINIESTSPPINVTTEGEVGIGSEIGICSWVDEDDVVARIRCIRLALEGLSRVLQGKEAFPKPSPTPPPLIYGTLTWIEPDPLTIVWQVVSGFYEIGFRSDGVVVWRKEVTWD